MEHILIRSTAICAAVAFLTFAGPSAEAQDARITVSNLDAIMEANPLAPDGPAAKVVATERAGNSELQVLAMRTIRLHHHNKEDHVVYIAEGTGTARIENESGKIETRPVQPGDIFNLPRGLKHAFESTGDQTIVMLVVATAGWKPLEDTTFHE